MKPRRKPGVKPYEVDVEMLTAAYHKLRSVRLVAQAFGLSRMTIQRRIAQAEIAKPPRDTTNVGQADSRARHKATGIKRKPVLRCESQTCDRTTTNPPYCDRCRLRAQRHGDPATVNKRGRKAT